jgi:phage gp36-like protein
MWDGQRFHDVINNSFRHLCITTRYLSFAISCRFPVAIRYSLPFRYHCTLSLSKIGSGKVPTGVDEDGASAWSGKTIVPSKIA